MRLGVLDVGSITVHLLVVDAYPGARPLPVFSHKEELRLLAAHLEQDNRLSAVGEERLTSVVSEAMRIAEDKGVEDFVAFATSAIREAVNGDEVLARVREQTPVCSRTRASTSSPLTASLMADVANATKSSTPLSSAIRIASDTTEVSRSSPTADSLLSCSRCAASSRSSSLCENAGSGRAPG